VAPPVEEDDDEEEEHDDSKLGLSGDAGAGAADEVRTCLSSI
jgi:hypothetical protein